MGEDELPSSGTRRKDGEKKINIFVSGSKGFISRHLIKLLEDKGHTVIGYDIIDGYDLRDYGQMKLIFDTHKPEQVYHIGGQAYLDKGEANPYYDIDVNIKGMINILRCCTEHNSQLLYTSSGAIYGVGDIPHYEDNKPIPVSNYGCSKLAAEQYLNKWAITEALDAKTVRFSSIYGKGRNAGPVNIFCKRASENKSITIYGSGGQTRDYVHVSDVCNGMILVMERGKRGEAYNLGYGEEHSVSEVAHLVKKHHSSTEILYEKAEYSAYDLPRSWFDVGKAKKLGYNPKIDLPLGVNLTLFEYMENV